MTGAKVKVMFWMVMIVMAIILNDRRLRRKLLGLPPEQEEEQDMINDERTEDMDGLITTIFKRVNEGGHKMKTFKAYFENVGADNDPYPRVEITFQDGTEDECTNRGKDFNVLYSTVLRKAAHECPSIAMDANVLCGSPRIVGTRIPVYMIVDAVQHYGTVEGARTSYPELTVEQVKDALSFAGAVLEQPIEHEP